MLKTEQKALPPSARFFASAFFRINRFLVFSVVHVLSLSIAQHTHTLYLSHEQARSGLLMLAISSLLEGSTMVNRINGYVLAGGPLGEALDLI